MNIKLTKNKNQFILSVEAMMKSLVLTIDDNVYGKFVDFIRIFPENKVKIIDEIPCNHDLVRELKKRKKEIVSGKVISHEEFWKDAGF